jgi:hypothetical protein
LLTLRALRSSWASRPGRAGLTSNALWPVWPCFPALTDSGLPALPGLARRTTVPGRADFAGRAGRTGFASRTSWARLADVAGRTRWPDVAGRTRRSRFAIDAIAQGRQARGDGHLQIPTQGHDFGAQLGDRRPRLRLDQLARAFPLALLIGENLAERLAPRVN